MIQKNRFLKDFAKLLLEFLNKLFGTFERNASSTYRSYFNSVIIICNENENNA